MLCFVFSALIVLLDQVFKRWVTIAIVEGGETVIIPGVVSLLHVRNYGAAFSILQDQRWLLAGISFIAAIVLIFILLRYNEGFWGTLGLAAVLGGTIGNMIDRVYNGYVVDMFRLLFLPNFAIFNIADIFITMGFATFCIHFICASIRSSKGEELEAESAEDSDDEEPHSMYDAPEVSEQPDFDFDFDADMSIAPSPSESDPFFDAPEINIDVGSPGDAVFTQGSNPTKPSTWQEYYDTSPVARADTSPMLSALESLESDLGSIDDYNVDDLLREYGFDDSDTI